MDDFIETAGGDRFFPSRPESHEFIIEDIAFSLAGQCRYLGVTTKHYSVAEHCMHVYSYLKTSGADKRTLRAALLHDAAEAYIGDIPGPVKAVLPDYRALEDRVMAAIAKQFDFDWPLPAAVVDADRRIVKDERAQAIGISDNEWESDNVEELGIDVRFLDRDVACGAFLLLCEVELQ